jgi:uncharacterized protein involved in response to NO
MKYLTSFIAAPHRVMFFGGAVQTIAVMLWWIAELLTRYGIVGAPMTWPIAPSFVHAYLMIYGLFPFFIFGFVMTVFPRWMNGREIPARYFVPAFALLILGSAGFYAGLFISSTILAVAAFSTLAGWAIALYALLRVLLDTQHPDKRHPKVVFVALTMGWCSLASWLVWLLGDNAAYLHFATQSGLWLFLLPVFASVAHRMFPFFTSSALPNHPVPRPFWPLPVMLAASVAHGLLALQGASAWLWLSDVPLAVAALYLTWAWGLQRSFRIPLLAVLHIGFAWLGISMLLFAAQSLLSFSGDGTTQVWGLAPQHALTIGCYATLLIGMGTRVTLGHSGLPMQVDTPIMVMFSGIQLAALLRVLADMLPLQGGYWLYVAAAAIWLACFSPWVLRYLPAYWRPRADGRAG